MSDSDNDNQSQNQNHNNNDNNNNGGQQLLNQLATIFNTQNQLLENSNPAQFQYKFPGKNHETLSWIFAAEKFLRVNSFVTDKIKFQRVFASLNNHYQNRYLMDTMNEDDNTTFDSLKTWVLKEYLPPKTKFEFKLTLSSMLMRKNEDPNLAYSRWKYKLKLINKAITTINEGLWAETLDLYPNDDDQEDAENHFHRVKLLEISDEDKHESLTRMFVIRNNRSQWDNDGKINALVYKYIVKKDPRSMVSWNLCFNNMKRELIPRILDGQKDYEYQSYPVDENNDNIYIKKHHQPSKYQKPKPKRSIGRYQNEGGRKRLRDRNQKRGPPRKRQKIICSRCHRIGHAVNVCHAIKDVNGNVIKGKAPAPYPKHIERSQPQKGKCTICGLNNHLTRDCYHKDGGPKCYNCGKIGHISSDCRSKKINNRSYKTKNAWRQYGQPKLEEPSDQHPNSSQQREINALNKSFERSQREIIDNFKQWMSNNDNIDDVQAQQFQSFADNMAQEFHPRQS